VAIRHDGSGKKWDAKMVEVGKDATEVVELQSRRGFKRYSSNPSVPAEGFSDTKTRPVRIPGADKGMLFADGQTGELIGSGVRHFFKFEEVDATRFVKLFLDGMKQAAGLSRAGMQVFELVYRELQEKPNADQIPLSYHLAKQR